MSHPFGSDFNAAFRHGSAAWASGGDIRRAGLFHRAGLQIGFYDNQPVYMDGDAPITLVAGSGAGKMRDCLSFIAADCAGRNTLWNDPRGEIYASFSHNHDADGDESFAYNPFAVLAGLIPQHRINPLDILTPDSTTLQADAKLIADSLITPAKGDNAYFGQRARGILTAFLVALVLKDDRVSFKTLMAAISSIQGDPIAFAKLAEWMVECDHMFIRRTAGEILTMLESPKTLGSILGEIYGQCAIFDDPMVADSLSTSDVSLRDYMTKEGLHGYFIVPADFQQAMAPVLRTLYQVAMIYKSRAPKAPRLTLIIDEAAQLGRADFIMRAYTYARGAGIRTLCVWQDLAQIRTLYGQDMVTTFLGSSQTKIFFGIRDLNSAQYVSNSLGTQTLEYDDDYKQQDAHHKKLEAMQRGLMGGGDMLASAIDYAHWDAQEQHRSKQSRNLMTNSEVLAMPEDRMIVFISGLNLNPLYLEKYPYYERLDAQNYRDNPYYLDYWKS